MNELKMIGSANGLSFSLKSPIVFEIESFKIVLNKVVSSLLINLSSKTLLTSCIQSLKTCPEVLKTCGEDLIKPSVIFPNSLKLN